MKKIIYVMVFVLLVLSLCGFKNVPVLTPKGMLYIGTIERVNLYVFKVNGKDFILGEQYNAIAITQIQ